MKKKRYLKTFVCLILGAVLLSGSAFANYENASGYTKLKNGMLNMMTVENFSADAKFTLNYNGNELTSQQVAYQYDRSGSTSEYTKSFGSDGSGETWIQDGFNISHFSNDIYSYTVYNAYSKGFNDSYLTGTEEERSMTDKTVNFAELLCDTLVGDLKNNFVLVSAENGISTYQINLSKEQIPELIQSGLSLIFGRYSYSNYGYICYENPDNENMTDEGELSRYEKAFEVYQEHDSQGVVYVREDGTIEYYATESEYFQATGNVSSLNSLYSVFDSDPSISGVSCTVTLDSEGRLSYLKATGSLTGKDADGNEQNMTLDLELSIYDYGTTSIKAFDKSLLNFDWNATDGYRYYYFDSEGNIVQYDSYQYDEYGNLISEDKDADVELIDPATDDESAA